MNFPFYIAKRYLFSKSSNNAINIITIIATVGVIVGALALFLVLSVFSGLKLFSVDILNQTDPNVKIISTEGKSFEFTEPIENILSENNGIISYSKIIEERAFFKKDNKEQIAYFKAVDSAYSKTSPIESLIYSGHWLEDNSYQAVVGNGIANKIEIGVLNYGEPLQIFVPSPGKQYIHNIEKAFSKIHVTPVGVFSVSLEIDNKYVYLPLNIAQKLLNYKTNQIGHIEIKTQKGKQQRVIDYLNKRLGDTFTILSREQLNSSFYKILNTEKLISYLIFTLVLIIALFNVIGSMLMMIIDKKKNLKTLYDLGSSIKDIKRIFIFQGVLLSVFGWFTGITLGVILLFIQLEFEFIKITPTIAYPVAFEFENILIVSVTLTVLGYFASKIASSRISKKLWV